MKTNTVMSLLVVAVLALSIMQALQIASIKDAYRGTVISASDQAGSASAGGAIDTTGWTDNEKMNYEMHGVIPARVGGKTQASGSTPSAMVGGC